MNAIPENLTTRAIRTPTHGDALRYSIYTGVHKGLRALMSDTLARVSRMDPHDPAEVAEAIDQLRILLAVCRGHLEKEEHFVHPAMERALPNSALHTADDHVEHLQAIAALEARMAELAAAGGEQRTLAAHRLYLEVSHFVGDNFTHMFVEETANQAVLTNAYSDDELLALEAAIVASIPPQEAGYLQRWIIPGLNALERLALFKRVRAHAPPQAFAGLLALARETLSERDWRKLEQGLQ